MKLIIAAICTFAVIWCLLYALVKPQAYYKCLYNDDVVFVDSKDLLFVNVICDTGEHVKISLFFFTHNFELA